MLLLLDKVMSRKIMSSLFYLEEMQFTDNRHQLIRKVNRYENIFLKTTKNVHFLFYWGVAKIISNALLESETSNWLSQLGTHPEPTSARSFFLLKLSFLLAIVAKWENVGYL